jgi:hypothetical protein
MKMEANWNTAQRGYLDIFAIETCATCLTVPWLLSEVMFSPFVLDVTKRRGYRTERTLVHCHAALFARYTPL